MKKLYLVPIIHTAPDMGSFASTLDKRAAAGLGQEVWQRHKEIVTGFWASIARFFDSLDVSGFKVYQDGLVADGAEGRRIVKEGIRQGSKNYEIIGRLLEGGAILVKTEDISLVKQERDYILKMTGAKSLIEKESVALRYKLAQVKLLGQRDDSIAKRIKGTLGEGETGILFIGAYHEILPRLPADIRVTPVKAVAKVRDYHKALMKRKSCDQQLAEYLISPVLGARNTIA